MTTIFQNVTFIYTKSTLILKACVGWLTDDKSGAFYFAQKDPIYLKVLFRQKSHPILEHSVSSFTFHEMGFAIS